MSTHTWTDVKRIFQTAAELPVDQREAYLDDACAKHAGLRADVESLLQHHGADDALEPPSLQTVARIFENAETRGRVGCRVGAYELIRLVDSGGMGHVYLARRADGQFEKHVAVKIIRHGVDAHELRRRFLNEQQALAALDHAHIARLLDGGVTPDGLSYLVMEYIEGRPIDEYCDVNRLSTDARIDLFRTVCSAVHYAHQRLVIHRDLKPSNILVTEDGVPKLLDFGIAKLVDRGSGSSTIPLARLSVPYLTPEYASPEQVRGETITTASDVYSLGVILYEMLTGRRPHRHTHGSHQMLARMIVEEEPARPSTAVRKTEEVRRHDGTIKATLTPDGVSRVRDCEPDSLRRRLSGDLDNICLMALRKEPHRRYGSVEQFAEDLRRHRVGLPVIARKDTFTYRAVKFVRRNRAAVVAASLLVLALVGGIIGTSAALVAVRRAQDKTLLMNEFLENMLAEADVNNVGRDLTVREMLDRAARRVADDFDGHPDVEAGLRTVIGNAYLSLRLPAAEAHLKRAYELKRAIHGDEHPEIAESLHNLAVCAYVRSRLDDAERFAREALAMQARLTGEHDGKYIAILDDLAVILRTQGDLAGAEPLYQKALALNREIFGARHLETARTMNNYAVLLKLKGELDRAEEMYRKAIDIRREHLDDHHAIATSLSNLGALLQARGDDAAAEPLYREALELQRKLLGPEHPAIAVTENNLAMLLISLHRLDEAQNLFTRALDSNRQRLGERHPQVGTLLFNLGSIHHRRNELEQAETMYRQALDIRIESLGEEHPDVATSLNGLGSILVDQNRLGEAEEYLQRGLAMRRALFPDGNSVIALSLEELLRLRIRQGNNVAAEALARESLAVRRRHLCENHPDIDFSAVRLASVLIDQRQPDEARQLLDDVETHVSGRGDPAGMLRLELVREQARLRMLTGDPQAAERLIQDALEAARNLFNESHPEFRRTLRLLDEIRDQLSGPSRTSEAIPHEH